MINLVRLSIFIGLVLSRKFTVDFDLAIFGNNVEDWPSSKSCFERATLGYKKLVSDATEQKDSFSCRFNFDQHFSRLFVSGNQRVNKESDRFEWVCTTQDKSLICDGSSMCLTDECWCSGNSSDIFYCSDGSGCVTFDKLCNNIQDCLDGSDECFCPGHLVVPDKQTKICFSKKLLCNIDSKLIVSMFGYKRLKETRKVCKTSYDLYLGMNPLYECLHEVYRNQTTLKKLLKSPERIPLYCKSSCTHVKGFVDGGWVKFCDRVFKGDPYDYVFICDFKSSLSNDFGQPLAILCDVKVDCKSGQDEMGCPGRFYCSPNSSTDWVEPERVCDHVKDCTNGADECGTCEIDQLSSSEFLINSKIVVVVTGMLAIIIIIMNSVQIFNRLRTPSSSNTNQTEKIYLINLFLHDLVMGIYLGGIVIVALVIRLKGKYCLLESAWRSSWVCSAFGVAFSSSAHGSLLTIALMSYTRFRTCSRIGVHIKQRYVVGTLVVTNIINWFHSYLPLLPITVVREFFRTEIFFKHLKQNPFFNKNPINMTQLLLFYEGMIHHTAGTNDVYKIIDSLRNLTSREDIFDIEEISYYGNTGLCIHNIFKSQGSYRPYKISYCASLTIIIGFICMTYLKILFTQKISRRNIVNAAGNENIHKGVQTNSITLKISLMIGSQLSCWIPFIFTIIFFEFIIRSPPSPLVFELFALIIIPLNSLLNPLFYSKIYKKLIKKLWEYWRNLVDMIT